VANKSQFIPVAIDGFNGFVKAMVPGCLLEHCFIVQLHDLVVDRCKVFAIIIRTIRNDSKMKQYPLIENLLGN